MKRKNARKELTQINTFKHRNGAEKSSAYLSERLGKVDQFCLAAAFALWTRVRTHLSQKYSSED